MDEAGDEGTCIGSDGFRTIISSRSSDVPEYRLSADGSVVHQPELTEEVDAYAKTMLHGGVPSKIVKLYVYDQSCVQSERDLLTPHCTVDSGQVKVPVLSPVHVRTARPRISTPRCVVHILFDAFWVDEMMSYSDDNLVDGKDIME